MKRTAIDRDYIVIRVRKDTLWRAAFGTAILLLVPVYPLLYLLEVTDGSLGFYALRFPYNLIYPLLAPLILGALSRRSVTGAPPDRRFLALCGVWSAAALLLAAASVALMFVALPVAVGVSEPVLGLERWELLRQPELFGSFAYSVVQATFFCVLALWVFELLFADWLGPIPRAGYFLNAGILVSACGFCRVMEDLSAPSALSRILWGHALVLVEGALCCVLALTVSLFGESEKKRRYPPVHYYDES